MRRFQPQLYALLCLLLAGCLPFQGQALLDNAEYDRGLQLSRQALTDQPDDPATNYYAGRFLLAKDRPEEALPLLRRAAQLEPDNADYHFWLGVNRWALFDFQAERAEYQRALALDPDHLPAHLYLGHNCLDAGEWRAALREYDEVLKLYPLEPGAMFNRAMALDRLQRTDEAGEQLLAFMKAYPDGDMAIRAVDRLREYGDFTYRNYVFGKRTVPLRAIAFVPGSDRPGFDVRASLDVLGALLSNNAQLRVHVVAYVRGDANLARARAEYVRRYVTLHYPDVSETRLLLSWFGTGERVHTLAGDRVLPESLNLITAVH